MSIIEIEGDFVPAPDGIYTLEDGTKFEVKQILKPMKNRTIEELIKAIERAFERDLQPPIKDEFYQQFEKEKKQEFKRGIITGIVCLFALIGILSLFSSCNKCVTCTRTTTTTDLNDVPTSSTHESFPICDRNEKKYWNGRKTSESKGTYKLKTYTTCSK